MACEVIVSSGAVFALWGKPTKDDVDHVRDELKRAAARAGHPVVYVTRVPTDAPAPDDEVRKHLSANIGTMILSCSSYHVIMEGTGFLAAIKRGALTSLLQPIWKKKKFYVHAHPGEVTGSLSDDERVAAEESLALADRRGYLSCQAPTIERVRASHSGRPSPGAA